VAGLLLAPETGDETRSGLKKSASKWGDDLGKLLKDGLAKLNEMQGAPADTQNEQGRSAADDLLSSMNSGQNSSAPAAGIDHDDSDSDYDGSGGDGRHSAGYGRSL
jgi:gas vesicle protein